MRFVTHCHPDHVEIEMIQRRIIGHTSIFPEAWKEASGPVLLAVHQLMRLVTQDLAGWDGFRLRVPNAAASRFDAGLSTVLGLPGEAPVVAKIRFHGTISSPSGRVEIEWRDTNYREIAPTRTGVQLSWGSTTGRLSGSLFDLIEAADGFNRSTIDDFPHRVECWNAVRSTLAQVRPELDKDEYTASLEVFQAASLALDVTETPGGIDFKPLLMRRANWRPYPAEGVTYEHGSRSPVVDDAVLGHNGDAAEEVQVSEDLVDSEAGSLLVSEDNKKFLALLLQEEDETRRSYPLRKSTYLLLDPDLTRALDVVKRMRRASEMEKREFIKNPRTVIAAALGKDGGDALLSSLFIETKQYSDRVTGLGLWTRPDLPWLRRISIEWLPEKFPARVRLGEKEIEIAKEEAEHLKDTVTSALYEGAKTVEFRRQPIPVATAQDILEQIDARVSPTIRETTADETGPAKTDSGRGQLVILIKTNFEGREYIISSKPRKRRIGHEVLTGRLGGSIFKAHQAEGFDWLVKAWVAGWPGVLLADDMGLGKTFQALAFMAWLRANQEARPRQAKGSALDPMLIVAPTALLENWIDEANIHLAAHALGYPAKLYGSDLKGFKNTEESDEPLDVVKMRNHPWILTTYETLADNHRSFAKIAYSLAIFDEIQKIKEPGTLNTFASKAMNVDFTIGLTGTPVENRIEDLWSIMDRVCPGYLGDLKSFSKDYESESQEKYQSLRDRLSQPVDGAPPIMLRRLKRDVARDLPEKREIPYRVDMPPIQAKTYEEAVRSADNLGKGGRGAKLQVIQKLRSVSLFPDDPGKDNLLTTEGCRQWVERSARLRKTVEILTDLRRQGEKALIFVEHRYMQDRFAQAVTTIFELEEWPLIINGAVPGPLRKKLVDRFSVRKCAFDLIILSPKAAGVGLNITAANHVVHLSRWWNPAVEDQCNDRVYRMGQKRPVTIHVPMAVHPVFGERSFDLRLHELLDRKRSLSRSLLAPAFTQRDLDEMFSATIAR